MKNKDDNSLLEINLIYDKLKSKYASLFDKKSAYDTAKFLYENGIRTYMFDVEELDIDEIVRYVVNRKKFEKFPGVRSNVFSALDEEEMNDRSSEVISLLNRLNIDYMNILGCADMSKKVRRNARK